MVWYPISGMLISLATVGYLVYEWNRFQRKHPLSKKPRDKR